LLLDEKAANREGLSFFQGIKDKLLLPAKLSRSFRNPPQ